MKRAAKDQARGAVQRSVRDMFSQQVNPVTEIPSEAANESPTDSPAVPELQSQEPQVERVEFPTAAMSEDSEEDSEADYPGDQVAHRQDQRLRDETEYGGMRGSSDRR